MIYLAEDLRRRAETKVWRAVSPINFRSPEGQPVVGLSHARGLLQLLCGSDCKYKYAQLPVAALYSDRDGLYRRHGIVAMWVRHDGEYGFGVRARATLEFNNFGPGDVWSTIGPYGLAFPQFLSWGTWMAEPDTVRFTDAEVDLLLE